MNAGPTAPPGDDEPTPTRPSPIFPRIAAALLDFTIVAVPVLMVQLIWTRPGERTVPTTGSNWLALAIIVAYPVVNVARSGRTVGKRLFGLRVERADGRPVGWLGSVVRFAVAYAAFFTGPLLGLAEGSARTALEVLQFLVMIGVYAPILWDGERRGLHDIVARTHVVTLLPPLLRPPPGSLLRDPEASG